MEPPMHDSSRLLHQFVCHYTAHRILYLSPYNGGWQMNMASDCLIPSMSVAVYTTSRYTLCILDPAMELLHKRYTPVHTYQTTKK